MKFLLMMNHAGQGAYAMNKWPLDDIKRHIGFMIELNKKLRASGELVGAEGLAPPDQAKRVRADKAGKPVTDGVFPESKEFLVGYWMVDVESADRAYAIAAEASAAPGHGGEPMNMAIEVREIMSGPPKDLMP